VKILLPSELRDFFATHIGAYGWRDITKIA